MRLITGVYGMGEVYLHVVVTIYLQIGDMRSVILLQLDTIGLIPIGIFFRK